jgi:hypothetical protein
MSKADWHETILSLGGPIAVGIITFGVMLAMFWLWDRLKRIIDGTYSALLSEIADQGDDWSPLPWSGRDPKPGRTSFWVIPPCEPRIQIQIDPTRPAWHSAVSVQTVEFTKPATTAFTAGGDA